MSIMFFKKFADHSFLCLDRALYHGIFTAASAIQLLIHEFSQSGHILIPAAYHIFITLAVTS